jgi:hypothetical protein
MKFVHGHNRRKQGPEYRVNETTGCWDWIMGTTGRYGMRNNVSAHRKYYALYKGPIPTGLVIDHLCRNTLCVNPDHLEAVTQAVNLERRYDHERKAHGRVLGGRKPKAA